MVRKRLAEVSYYELLGLEKNADQGEVKAAFHRFALRYHPDRAESLETKATHTRIYRRGTEAYRVLSHAAQRAAYDEGLELGKLRLEQLMGLPLRSSRPPSMRPVSPRARPFLIEAEHAVERGDYRNARVHLQVALGHDPEHPELLSWLAKVESAIKQGLD